MASFQSPHERCLKRLECHFTWGLSDSKRSPGLVLRRLKEVHDCGGCAWEAHLYNLLGYYYDIKGSTEEALECLKKAEAILRDQEAEGRGPRLLVNQANLAWVHYHLGEMPESKAYIEEVAQLKRDFPAPPGCDLHPEVYGEKGWTQIKLDYQMKKKAITNFEMALRGDPNRKEWHAGLAQAKYRVYRKGGMFRKEIVEQFHTAKKMDPDNIRISVLYLTALANVGIKTEKTVQEAHDLIHQLKTDLDGLEDILNFIRIHDSLDSALRAAEEVVRKHPTKRAKKQLALHYKVKIFDTQTLELSVVRKGIDIHEEVTRLYPQYIMGKIDLAVIHANSGNIVKADEIFTDLLHNTEDLVPEDLQLLYHHYGSYLNKFKTSSSDPIDYHKKAAEIPNQSRNREKSIQILGSIVKRGNHPRCDEICDFLSNINLN